MFKIEFNPKAVKEFEKLPLKVRKRILKKLKFYSSQKNPLRFAKKISDPRFGEYRFRIGDYRLIFDFKGKKILILKIGHRKDIYK